MLDYVYICVCVCVYSAVGVIKNFQRKCFDSVYFFSRYFVLFLYSEVTHTSARENTQTQT